ncbi:single-stranded DNA-binding protein [Paraburkholderia pallida]|uniref:Single-stranded DNA-binding protein n=1 Tax=Paraburkholderia pallida TaxID=2547399 RepID=A0A4P7CVC5_9BURK|nr:single-stranded DNA-binding protein [Paraburkholderia pallida]QBQ97903.1 single-stranded DNA-binding protein [Paraburkholderia pallida]
MIDGLIAGKMYGAPGSKTGQSGKTFVTAKVRAAAGDGEALFVNVIAFDDAAKSALLALGNGDSVTLAGTLTPRVWMNRDGDAKPALDMVAHAVLTAYHVTRKRAAIRDHESGNESHSDRPATTGAMSDFDDDL